MALDKQKVAWLVRPEKVSQQNGSVATMFPRVGWQIDLNLFVGEKRAWL
jgi:hypothetical protein